MVSIRLSFSLLSAGMRVVQNLMERQEWFNHVILERSSNHWASQMERDREHLCHIAPIPAFPLDMNHAKFFASHPLRQFGKQCGKWCQVERLLWIPGPFQKHHRIELLVRDNGTTRSRCPVEMDRSRLYVQNLIFDLTLLHLVWQCSLHADQIKISHLIRQIAGEKKKLCDIPVLFHSRSVPFRPCMLALRVGTQPYDGRDVPPLQRYSRSSSSWLNSH